MKDVIVRIESVEISNFKNVKYGKIKLNNEEDKASMLGLYGQNGSGKSALIDALGMLKIVMSGEPLPSYIRSVINIDSESATFKYLFSIREEGKDNRFLVTYQFSVFKLAEGRVSVRDEIFSYIEEKDGDKAKSVKLISTNAKSYFNQENASVIDKDLKLKTEISFIKRIVAQTGISFVFSKDFRNVVAYRNKLDKKFELIIELRKFAVYKLFTVDTNSNNYKDTNSFPMYFTRISEDGDKQIAKVMVSTDKPMVVTDETFNYMKNALKGMNNVLYHIMPGLKISMQEVTKVVDISGKISRGVQLYAVREKSITPLSFESEGIKKIIASLQLLIWAYNDKSVTIGIDEIDSGIFEYLLGEILHVFENGGRGQLFFTAHNLRPLETLNKNNIMFTSTNENNRYMRLKNLKNNNNLRLVYYREILLGNQDKEIYNSTNAEEIAFALREAGEVGEA